MLNRKKKKIGLIGNMNNNNFAFLRYLIDLGFDAKLILMKNDGKGVASGHFSIENDTWDSEKWNKYIVQSEIYEHPISALDFPVSFLFSAFLRVKRFLKGGDPVFSVSRSYVRNILSEYDVLIGSGIAPALLARINQRLTIFYPYAIGVEYLADFVFETHLTSKNPIKKLLAKIVYRRQLKGLKMAQSIVVGDIGCTKDKLTALNLPFVELLIPFVYNKEKLESKFFNRKYQNIIKKIQSKNFVLLSHVRHLWANSEELSDEAWKNQNKHNDWIVEGFAKFLRNNVEADALLIMFEYGADFEMTKALARTIGVDSKILWLKIAPRKEILQLIDYVDVGIGEFYSGIETIWGGSMVEIMSKGKPTVHGLNIQKAKLEEELKIVHPPILVANSSTEIADKISYVYEDKKRASLYGANSKKWFENNYGEGLAKKWVKLFD